MSTQENKTCKYGHTERDKHGCVECRRKATKKYLESEKYKELNRARAKKNKENQDYRIYQREYVRRYLIKNKKQIPSWSDHEKILEVFRDADNRQLRDNEQYTVAMDVPLNSVTVSGLWVPENLVVVKTSEVVSFKEDRKQKWGYHYKHKPRSLRTPKTPKTPS